MGTVAVATARGLTVADVLPAAAGGWQDLNVGLVAPAPNVAATAALDAATQDAKTRAA